MQKSMGELIATGTSLSEAIKAQVAASDALKKSTDKATDGLKGFGKGTEDVAQKTENSRRVVDGFYMELGAMGTRLATQLPSAITATIQAFGRQGFGGAADYAKPRLGNPAHHHLRRRAGFGNAGDGVGNGG